MNIIIYEQCYEELINMNYVTINSFVVNVLLQRCSFENIVHPFTYQKVLDGRLPSSGHALYICTTLHRLSSWTLKI